MLKEGKFGYHEGMSLIIIVIATKAFFTSPSMVARIVGTAGWYMTLISAAVAALLFMLCYLLLKRFPNKNIMQINDTVLGKILGSVVSFIIFVGLLMMASIGSREFTEIIKIYVLPESPPSFILIMFVIAVVTLAFMGLETIARFAKFMIYILAAGFLLVELLASRNYNLSYLFPLLGYGLDRTLINGILRCSFYGEVVLVSAIALSLQGPREIKRIGLWSILVSGLVTSMVLLSFSLVFPYTTAQESSAPMYALASMIDLGEFLQRMEPIFVFLWNFASIIKVSILFYCSIMVICHIFQISDRRPTIMPMSTILFCMALFPEGLPEITVGIVQTVRTWGWTFYFLPIIFVLLISVIRKKRGTN